MQWNTVRARYPDQWLVIEALEARSENDQRILEQIAVLEPCQDGLEAMQRYRAWRQQYPARELYYVHTAREALQIAERHWLGIRRGHAADPAG
jgi:hypothetical protein